MSIDPGVIIPAFRMRPSPTAATGLSQVCTRYCKFPAADWEPTALRFQSGDRPARNPGAAVGTDIIIVCHPRQPLPIHICLIPDIDSGCGHRSSSGTVWTVLWMYWTPRIRRQIFPGYHALERAPCYRVVVQYKRIRTVFPDHIIVRTTRTGEHCFFISPCTSFTVLLIVAFLKYQSLTYHSGSQDVLTHISILMLL